MAPTRNTSKSAPKASTSPYWTRSKQAASERSSTKAPANASHAGSGSTDDKDDNIAAQRSSKRRLREVCTVETTAALTELIWRAKGFPNQEEKQEISSRTKK